MQRIPSLARYAGFAYSKYVLLTLVLVLSACAGSRGPAPIDKRTGDSVRPADAPREPNLTPTPLPAIPPPADNSGVQTAPVRPSGIESRPLDARAATQGQPVTPAGPAGAAGTTGPTGSAVGGLGSLRTGPKGLKRPFSDTALAEMKALEPLPPVAKLDPLAPVPAIPANPVATAGAGKPAEAEKSVPTGALDLAWPLRGKVVQAFAEPKQVGIIVDGKLGDPVAAAADGKVIFSGPGPRGYGNLLIVKHDAETVTVYAHNKTLLAKEGQSVKRGQKIAEVGDTGSDRVGLHFEVRKQGKPVDPQKLLPKR